MTVATAEYRSSQDVIAAFIEDACVESDECRARARDLYAAFRKWCEGNGEKPASKRVFGEQLAERGYERFTSNGVWYHGITVLDEENAALFT